MDSINIIPWTVFGGLTFVFLVVFIYILNDLVKAGKQKQDAEEDLKKTKEEYRHA